MALDRDTTFTWYGHSCFEIRTPGGKIVLIDPWFGEPDAARGPADSVERCDLMLVTHGHFDHMGDAVAARQPAPAGLAVHPRDEPVARPPAARRRRRGDRHEQGRHGRGRRASR